MFLIRHVIQDGEGHQLLSRYLREGAYDDAHAEELIAAEQARFDHSGYDAEHARWWARNNAEPLEINYWWTEVLKPYETSAQSM